MKNTGLYLAATALYLPLMIYAKNLPKSLPSFLKAFFFDGTFYHLWYFPAAIIGCNILMLLTEKSRKAAVAFSVVAYILGLIGDSYYGLAEDVPFLGSVYKEIFQFSSYTRNGIFFAPVFLLLGMYMAKANFLCSKKTARIGLCLSLPLLLFEGYLTYIYELQKHNSMYLCLPLVMYFLFQILLTVPGKAPDWFRQGSMLIYVIHPAIIVLLRGIAKAAKQTELLIDNTLIQYLSVCILSVIIAFFIHCIFARKDTCIPSGAIVPFGKHKKKRRETNVSKRKSLD